MSKVHGLIYMYRTIITHVRIHLFETGRPAQHEKIPVASRGKVDFLLNENVASDDPSMVMYKLHGNHTLYVLYYLHGHMHGSLFFIFLNHCLRDIIIYSRSQIHNPFEIFNEIFVS